MRSRKVRDRRGSSDTRNPRGDLRSDVLINSVRSPNLCRVHLTNMENTFAYSINCDKLFRFNLILKYSKNMVICMWKKETLARFDFYDF